MYLKLNRLNSTNDYYYFYIAGIVFFVLIFNLIGVFGPQYLIRDDMNGYYLVLEDIFPEVKVKRSFIAAYLYWEFWKIMIYSVELVRIIHVIFFMIPISIMLFFLYYKIFGISIWASFLSAVIPNILPDHETIPAFINGSYVVTGFVFIIASLVTGITFLEKDKNKIFWFLFSVTLFFTGSHLIAENDVFLIFPILLLYIYYKSSIRKKLFLIGSHLSIVLLKVYLYFYYFKDVTGAANSFHSLPSEEIIKRFIQFIQWGIPFINIDFKGIIVVIVLLISIIILTINKTNRTGSVYFPSGFTGFSHLRSNRIFFTYSFFIIFTITTSIVFITTSRSFQVRYMYLAYFGFYGIIFYIFSILINKVNTFKLLQAFIVLIIISYFGVHRYIHLNQIYENDNAKMRKITELINQYVPRDLSDAQLLITGIDVNTQGIWVRGSGYLKHITGRHDMNGQIDFKGRSFYNPFNTKARNWDEESVMNGFDLKKPLFAFRMEENHFVQMNYILQIADSNNESNIDWRIYSLNKIDGSIDIFAEGTDEFKLKYQLHSIIENTDDRVEIYGI